MKTERIKAFTLVELLTVVTIIAILLGVLMPALSEIKKLARTVRQKAQNVSIEIGLNLYKNDFDEYPPSHGWTFDNGYAKPYEHVYYYYSGAQTLAEAMFGQDLLGFDPNSKYDPLDANNVYADTNDRSGPYLDRTNIGVFEPNQIFPNTGTALNKKGHMICDTFTETRSTAKKKYKIGTPLLYFRANLSPANMQSLWYPSVLLPSHTGNVYNYMDNYNLIMAGRTNGKLHKLYEPFVNGKAFYKFIRDPMIPLPNPVGFSCGRPVRPDSFLLISAGYDGLYGTKDDICNFEPNFE